VSYLDLDYIPFNRAKWMWWNVFGHNMRSEWSNRIASYFLLTGLYKYSVHWLIKNDDTEEYIPINSNMPDRNDSPPLVSIGGEIDDFDVDNNNYNSLIRRIGDISQVRNLDIRQVRNPENNSLFSKKDMVFVPCIKHDGQCKICDYIKKKNFTCQETFNYIGLAKEVPSMKSVILNISHSKINFHTDRDNIRSINSNTMEWRNNFLVSKNIGSKKFAHYKYSLKDLSVDNILFIWDDLDKSDESSWAEFNMKYALGEQKQEAEEIIKKLKSIKLPGTIDFNDLLLTRYENVMVYSVLTKTYGKVKKRSDPIPSIMDRFSALEF